MSFTAHFWTSLLHCPCACAVPALCRLVCTLLQTPHSIQWPELSLNVCRMWHVPACSKSLYLLLRACLKHFGEAPCLDRLQGPDCLKVHLRVLSLSAVALVSSAK